MTDLDALLQRLAALDPDGWFRHPVRESDAPNYYKIIRRPMCFEFMRGKVRGRQYATWQELVRDFELIVSNAFKFNPKRSRVHKAALVLQRGGRKILAEAEPDGRRWVAALAASVTAGPGSLHLTHGDSQAVPSGLARAATAPGLLRSQSTADTASTEADLEPMQVDSLAAAEGDVDPAGYSSFEETDLEEDEAEGGWRVRRAGAAQQAAALFELARDAVLVQPWDAAAPLPAGGAAAPAAATQAGEQARQQQGAQPPAAAEESGAHSREWRAARRGVEWREYDVGELITPLGAPKFVERAQVKTIDTPRVRPLAQTELKKRQVAVDAYEVAVRKGSEDKAAAEAIDALCPGESSSEEDTSDEAYLRRHQQLEVEERARYEALLGAASKKNKQQQSKVPSKEQRSKHTALRPHVARTVSAPALVPTFVLGASPPAPRLGPAPHGP
ncbi:hypothetical protein COHA_003419 [Chlorella ohadii]|uniref:Bromo domain-containing protein n=1 Tax=Chlorella ohadii TaxID=2649997 RepID=A0AAD5DV06_9CHLO|nr:hypothetical protein COHA_003419 [Chlorella ohadii]